MLVVALRSLFYRTSLIFIATLFTASTSPAQIADLSREDNMRSQSIVHYLNLRNASYRRIILSAAGYGLISELNAGRKGCGTAVRNVLKKGGTFYSAHIHKKAVLMKDFPKGSGVQDNLYFHFTSNGSFADGLADSRVPLNQLNSPAEEVFAYRRLNSSTFSNGDKKVYRDLWGTAFYLSEDQASLASWYHGAYCIQFELDPEARMTSMTPEIFDPALKEIGNRYPEIKAACGDHADTVFPDAKGTVTLHPLNFIIAEETGMAAIDYRQGGYWFQFLSPDAFLSAKNLGRYNKGYSSENVLPDAGKIEIDYSYLTKPVLSIESARYGTKDVTREASLFVDGRTKVTYMVSGKFLGMTEAETKGQDFELEYSCPPGGLAPNKRGKTQTVYLNANEAEGRKIELSCTADPVILEEAPQQ